MAYIGRGTDSISNVEVLDNLTFDGSASYTLQKSSVNFVPSSANNLLISISGVVQQGNFSVSGSTITFDTTVSASDTCDWILHYGTGLITTVADGTITEAKLGSNAVTTAKINDSAITNAKITDGTIANAKLANSSITLNGSAVPLGGSATVGGVNTPYFQAKKTTTQNFSQNTQAVVLFDSEDFDDDGVYDTSTGKFQPNEAGKYLIHTQVTFANSGGNEYCLITKNGTGIKWGQNYPTGTAGNKKQDTSVIVSLNGSTDYVQVEALTSYAGTNTLSTSLLGTGDACTFYGFKIIE